MDQLVLSLVATAMVGFLALLFRRYARGRAARYSAATGATVRVTPAPAARAVFALTSPSFEPVGSEIYLDRDPWVAIQDDAVEIHQGPALHARIPFAAIERLGGRQVSGTSNRGEQARFTASVRGQAVVLELREPVEILLRRTRRVRRVVVEVDDLRAFATAVATATGAGVDPSLEMAARKLDRSTERQRALHKVVERAGLPAVLLLPAYIAVAFVVFDATVDRLLVLLGATLVHGPFTLLTIAWLDARLRRREHPAVPGTLIYTCAMTVWVTPFAWIAAEDTPGGTPGSEVAAGAAFVLIPLAATYYCWDLYGSGGKRLARALRRRATPRARSAR